MQLREDPSIRKNADIIITQIDRVSKLIRSLLNLARGDRAQGSERVRVGDVAGEVLELMAHEFRKNGIDVQNRLLDGDDILVHGKGESLHQVLLNLLVNSVHAIESARAGGRTDGHFIRLEGKRVNGDWEVSIADSGTGISKENLKKLFRPFFTTKDIGVGTGLGLATAFRILEAWGGTIRAESREDKGAIFVLRLPAAGETNRPA
jgi:signal transduction histidine kinase